MSRIAGVVSSDSAAQRRELISDSLDAIRGTRSWEHTLVQCGPATLGWSGCRQPVRYESDELIVVIDGCFFNREELDQGADDAERLAAMVQRLGFRDAVKRINGDFAIALFDRREETLWLARDRVGAKPLYYTEQPSGFAFASRTRSLLALPGVRPEVNRRYVAVFAGSHYRYFDNEPSESPFESINQLPAAHLLKCKDGLVQVSRYWSLQDLPDWDDSEEEMAERYRDLLLDAVQRRFAVADRPAFTLSGGMDSSSVLACAVNATGAKQHAFSTVYEDKTYDESDEIRTILDATVERWHTVPLSTPDVLTDVAEMVSLHDEPVATATWLSHHQLCRQARADGFGSLFGGLGGDELNAGEYEYFFFRFADLRASGQSEQLNQEIARWIEYHDHPIFKKSHQLVESELARIVDGAGEGVCYPERRRMTKYFPAMNGDFFNIRDLNPHMDHPFASYLKNRTYQDIFRETAPCCLRAEDRQATAQGLENYLPFFDHRLIEFMYRVPGEYKIRNGVTKVLLRKAMQGILPDETRNRIKKTGWNAPAHVWFTGTGRSDLMDLVRSRSFRERGIYDLDVVECLIDEHQDIMAEGRMVENHMMFLWQLVNLELWLRQVDEWSAIRSQRVAC